MYHDSAVVLTTSFADIDSYTKVYQELDWHYAFESEQVGICDYCDADYVKKDGVREEDSEGLDVGFCSQLCLEYDQIKRQEEADQLEQ